MKLTLSAWFTIWNGDGRRPSGAIYKTTKYKHWTDEAGRTLCGRTLQGNPSTQQKPACPLCQKRFEALQTRS